MVVAKYERLPALPNGLGDARDTYTDTMSYAGNTLPPPLHPGRGDGVGDLPSLKLINDPHPCRYRVRCP